MKTKLVIVITSIVAASLIFTTTQSSSAVTYSGHDGSVDKYLSKVKVEPYKNKKDLWVYLIKACATDRTLAVAGVILKSDIDTKVLGVNKNIRKGDCSSYGAVMNAKDGKTLGAELIEKHEALDRMQQILDDINTKNKVQKELAKKEYSELRQMTGFMLR
jgi:hypothetical protein